MKSPLQLLFSLANRYGNVLKAEFIAFSILWVFVMMVMMVKELF